MPSEDVIEALNELAPGQRALLDLSLNRELSDSLIAGLLENVDEVGVAGMRAEALHALANVAAIDGPGAAREVERQLRSASDQQWLGVEPKTNGANGARNGHANGHPRVHANGNGVVATVPSGVPPTRPVQTATVTTPDRSRRAWQIAFALLALAGVVSIIIALAGGDDDGGTNPSADAPSAATPPPPPAPAPAPAAPVQLEALTPGAVAGSATIAPAAGGDGLVLRLQGMPDPDGYYRLWLYDSLIESAPVSGIAAGSGVVRFELPADAAEFAYLDLAVEDSAADTIHSGRSVFRIPLSDID